MTKISFNLHKPLSELEAQKGRYSFAQISASSGITRQGIRRLLKEPTRQIDIDTIGKLLDFFAAEGMPITISDLFTVTQEPPQ